MSPKEPRAGRGANDPSKATPSKGKHHSGQVIPRSSRRPSSLHYCIRPGTNSPLTESPSTSRESPRTVIVLAPRATPEDSLIDSYSSGSSEDEDERNRATVLELHDDLDARRKSDGSPETGSQATGSTLGTAAGRLYFRRRGNEGPAPVKTYKHYAPQVEGERNGSGATDKVLGGDSVGLNSSHAATRLYEDPQQGAEGLANDDWHPTKTKPLFSTPDHLYRPRNNLPKPVHATTTRQSDDDVRVSSIWCPLDVFNQTKPSTGQHSPGAAAAAAAPEAVTNDSDPQPSPSPLDRLAEKSDGNPSPNAHFQFQSRSEDTKSRLAEEEDLRLSANHFDQLLLHG